MSLAEGVRLRVQVDDEGEHGVGRDRFRLLERTAVATAQDVARDHQLVAAHGAALLTAVRIDVDELHDPVGVGARRGGEERGGDIARDGEIGLERRGLPSEHVGAAVDEALVAREPALPLHIRRNGARSIGHRVRGVGNEGVVASARRRPGERERAVGADVQRATFGVLRRPRIVRAPLVHAGVEDGGLGDGVAARAVQVAREEARLQRAEVVAGATTEADVAERVAGVVVPLAVEPRADHEVVRARAVGLLECGERGLRSVRVFLVPEAADGEGGDRGVREVVLHAARLPDFIVGWMLNEALPRGPLGRARGDGERVEGGEGAIPVVRVPTTDMKRARAGRFRFASMHPLDAVALAKGALVEEVVAHPRVDHRRLRAHGLERGMRLDHGGVDEKAGIRDAEHADLPVGLRHVGEEPLERVPRVGGFVDALRVATIAWRAVHDELARRLVLAADVLEDEHVAVGHQLLEGDHDVLGAAPSFGAVGGAREQDGERTARVLRHEDHREELDAVAHRDAQVAAIEARREVGVGTARAGNRCECENEQQSEAAHGNHEMG